MLPYIAYMDPMGYDDVPGNSLLRQKGRTAKGPETLLNVNSKQVPQKRLCDPVDDWNPCGPEAWFIWLKKQI